MSYEIKYLKYKNKYITLKNQQGGVKCQAEYFTQHNGECWHDSLQMLLLFNNDIGDRLQHIIKTKTIQEIIDSPKKYKFLLPINIDYDDDFNSILSKYITDMILRFQNKICTIKPPDFKRELSFRTAISTAQEAKRISDIKKEEIYKSINTFENHGGYPIDIVTVLQIINYYFYQDDTNKFIYPFKYDKTNIDKLEMFILNKTNGIYISIPGHAVCLFKCGNTYMFYDDNGVLDNDKTIHVKEFDWYTLIHENINKLNLLDIILTEIKKISRKYFNMFSNIEFILCITENTFIDENYYYLKLLFSYNYFDNFYNNTIYKRLYNLLDNDIIFNTIIRKYYSLIGNNINKEELANIKLSLSNPKIIPDIFRTNKYSLKMLLLYSNKIINNKELIKELFYIDTEIFRYVSNILNKKFLIELFEEEPTLMFGASDKIKNDKDLIKVLVKLNPLDPLIFLLISDQLQNDKIFIKELIKINYNIIGYISQELFNDKIFIKELFKINYNIFKSLITSLQYKNDKEFIKELLEINCEIFEYIPEKLKEELKDDKN